MIRIYANSWAGFVLAGPTHGVQSRCMSHRRRRRRQPPKPNGTSLGLGIAALSLGCMSMLVIWIPATYYAAIPMAFLGVIIGIAALATMGNGGTGFPVSGFLASILGLIMTIGLTVATEIERQKAIDEIEQIFEQ